MHIPHLRFPKKGPVPGPALALACERFNEAGVMILEDIWSRRYIEGLRESFLSLYGDRLSQEKPHFSRDVGNKRIMISVDVEGAFNDRRFYANRHAFPLMSRLLGGAMIIGSFNAVTSLPGSRLQHLHADHPELFWDKDLDGAVPVYSISMSVPLVDLNAKTGTTRFYPGTHKTPWQEKPPTEFFDPEVRVGSAILFDIRVRHRGLGNRSDAPRPILYANYSRPWFHDYVNYDYDKALRITPAALERIPRKYRHLFGWSLVGEKPV